MAFRQARAAAFCSKGRHAGQPRLLPRIQGAFCIKLCCLLRTVTFCPCWSQPVPTSTISTCSRTCTLEAKHSWHHTGHPSDSVGRAAALTCCMCGLGTCRLPAWDMPRLTALILNRL
jgi:hypothetical protein